MVALHVLFAYLLFGPLSVYIWSEHGAAEHALFHYAGGACLSPTMQNLVMSSHLSLRAPVTYLRWRWGASLYAALLVACSAVPVRQDHPGLLLSDNLGDIKRAVTAYHNNGQYEQDLARAIAPAETYLTERAAQVKKPALVLDIDETSLSNWEQILANDFAYFPEGPCDKLPKGPCGVLAWDALARAPAIAPTLKLANEAKAQGIAIFFITGRYEAERAVTERNLRNVGFPQWTELFMRPDGSSTPSAADYKAPVRKRISEMGYTIVANVGDQPSDLAGGFAERTFLLPDPFYRIN